MRIGIYGGSFNPIHRGHISVAKYALEKLGLDKLIIIPVGIPSHKENNLVNGKLRMEMCRLAFENMGKIEISDIEINNCGTNYTYDTLMKIKNIYGQGEYFEIIGEDSGENFIKWKNYKEILKESKVIVLRRKGYKKVIENENMVYLSSPYFEISSTELRNYIKLNKNIKKYIPDKVEKFIRKHRLYEK